MRGLMPLRDAQQERPAAWCGECLGEIYPGETVYRWEGKTVCPDCFKWAAEHDIPAVRMGPHKRGYETDLVAKAIVQGRGMV